MAICLRERLQPEEIPIEIKCNGKECRSSNYCGVSSKKEYRCTRKRGHSGKHIACVGYTHNLEIWE
jgi:hypothetical protein